MISSPNITYIVAGTAHARYLGRELGALSELHHGVRGRVFAVDARTLFIQDFHYDGEGPGQYLLTPFIKVVGSNLAQTNNMFIL